MKPKLCRDCNSRKNPAVYTCRTCGLKLCTHYALLKKGDSCTCGQCRRDGKKPLDHFVKRSEPDYYEAPKPRTVKVPDVGYPKAVRQQLEKVANLARKAKQPQFLLLAFARGETHSTRSLHASIPELVSHATRGANFESGTILDTYRNSNMVIAHVKRDGSIDWTEDGLKPYEYGKVDNVIRRKQ